MSTVLHSWASTELPNPHRAKELVVARPRDVAREVRTRREMDELGIRPVGGTSLQTWEESLITAQIDSTNLTASNTATSILPPAAAFTLPANYFSIGKMIRISFTGRLGNIVTTPGTLTLDVRFGSLATPIVVFNGGAMQLSSTAHTTLPFWADVLLTCRAIGATTSANMMGQGRVFGQAISFTVNADLATSNTVGGTLFPNTTPAVGTGFDSTIANVVNVFGTFSLNNANAILVHQYVLEALN